MTEKKPRKKKEETEEKKLDGTVKPVKEKKTRKPKAAKNKTLVVRGKRKTSIARATITVGKGRVFFNRISVDGLNNKYVRGIILEPLKYLGKEATEVDLYITTNGGGTMGQAQAARTAVAKALTDYFDQLNLKDKFAAIDRTLLIEDTRRVESKKYRGPKARARFQKSYR